MSYSSLRLTGIQIGPREVHKLLLKFAFQDMLAQWRHNFRLPAPTPLIERVGRRIVELIMHYIYVIKDNSGADVILCFHEFYLYNM